ncbi:tyrosine-protein kinase Fes/Fps-like, partial [Saccostrea cucullata]|uniref:tyrosine-protein kinase Fes/Fps-like n=1 Tax=Saccostrea cuccullata TaxID=36930 RepID=UPI002ED1731D
MASSPSLFLCNFMQFLRATYCCPHRLLERKWHEELFHPLTELLLTGVADVFNKVDEKSEDFQTLLEVLKVSSQGFHAKWSFLPIPDEVHDLLFTLGHPVLQLVVKALDLSETKIRELAEANIKNTVPGLHVHDKDREIFSKTDERNYWSICGGRLYHFNVTISILIPDISSLKTNIHTEEAKSKHMRKTNEFEILLSMQKDYRHTCNSIAKLLAYGSSSLPLPFYVVENHPQGLLERLLEARRSHKWLPRSWMYERLQEMASCFTYLHSHRIVHRDITLHSFCLKTCLTSGKCMAVLQKLELAHSTTDASSSTHISVISGDWIPIRWSAPESILHGKYDLKTDVWMFGHTIHEMFTYGCEPYTELYSENTEDVIIRVVAQKIKPYKWKCIPHSFHILSTHCYDIHPEKRPPMHVVEKEIQTLRRDQSSRGSLDIGSYTVPHIGDKQLKREHKPERQYTFPSSSNILCIAEEMSKNSKEENVNTLLRLLFAVVKHVKQIHSMKWLMVDLTGKYVFIVDKQDMPRVFQNCNFE